MSVDALFNAPRASLADTATDNGRIYMWVVQCSRIGAFQAMQQALDGSAQHLIWIRDRFHEVVSRAQSEDE